MESSVQVTSSHSGMEPGTSDSQSREFSWSAFYREHFGIEIDEPSPMVGLSKQHRNGWHVHVPKELASGSQSAYDRVLAACRKQFKVTFPGDRLSQAIDETQDVRTLERGSYDILFSNEVDAHTSVDEKDLMQSARFPSLMERMLHGLAYFVRHGKHLDRHVDAHTLCLATRSRAGHIPFVRTSNGSLLIHFTSAEQLAHRQHRYSRQVLLAAS